jgi:cystathionine beta-lyase/cystathionine gamma-synthase
VGEGLIRIAVGAEDPEDLLADLARALATSAS